VEIPVKITELAEQMIILNGLKLKNNLNPEGDIDIVFHWTKTR
jgi:Predicted nucleoside-diphosphate sugar epimerases